MLHGLITEISAEQGPVADVCIQVGDTTLLTRITRRSLDQLKLETGMQAYATVKAVSLDRDSVGFA